MEIEAVKWKSTISVRFILSSRIWPLCLVDWQGMINLKKSSMSLKIITVGDITNHGGKIISGSPPHDISGQAIARLGNEVEI
ncbi:PAAR domain-containing protein [Paraherbaspirillum soli]|uniref:PAAR domain-containing protein n=1 Tax=Paraherbaspirillum soli TaxID=631222 RepID=A0ABW0M7Z6_9BURK